MKHAVRFAIILRIYLHKYNGNVTAFAIHFMKTWYGDGRQEKGELVVELPDGSCLPLRLFGGEWSEKPINKYHNQGKAQSG